MRRKRFKAEEIVNRLREANVLIAQRRCDGADVRSLAEGVRRPERLDSPAGPLRPEQPVGAPRPVRLTFPFGRISKNSGRLDSN